MNEIEKIFYSDIRDKKRIGNNIFKRVSTRKGGSNMSSMRVPTPKQQREWSGQVMTFNLNDIIPIKEFESKSQEDQKLLLEHWRTIYKTNEIVEGMGTNKNVFYRLINRLGIKKAERRPLSQRTPNENIVSDDEMKVIKETHLNHEIAVLESGNVISHGVNKNALETKHEANIHMSTGLVNNNFEFRLNGSYDSETIVRRLELIIEEIKGSKEKLNINISITN